MASKQSRESRKGFKNSAVSSRCVAIVFQRIDFADKSEREDGEVGNKLRPTFQLGSDTAVNDEQFDAKAVFEEFRTRNRTCYWNPALVDSVSSLEYAGFIEPLTLLVKGDDIHLENVRTAWGRRVLKNPTHFKIIKIGDVNGIEMMEIPQTQFIPLPEALCLIILDLNNSQIMATLDAVCEKLKQSYQGLHLPSNQHVYETLGHLIRERKVFHTGFGYFVVTPDTFRFHGDDVPTGSLFSPWTHLHPMYIPAAFSQPPKQATRSISCQVDVENNVIGQPESYDKDMKAFEYEEKLKVDLPMPRVHRSLSLSMRRSRDKTPKEEVTYEGTTKRSSSVKGRQEKNKTQPKDADCKYESKEEKPKEKVSLLSKLFGRGKKKAPQEPQKPAVEYATFSAQFPPPEWTWYQQQIDKQIRTETWVQQQMVKSGTWHYLNSLPTDSGTGSFHFATNSVPDRIPPVFNTQPVQASGFVQGVSRRSHKKSHKHKHRSAIVIANTQQGMNSIDPVDKHAFRNSMGQPGLRLSSLPTRLSSPTGELLHSNYVTHPMFNSTPRNGATYDTLVSENRAKQTVTDERKEPSKNKSHKKGHKSKKKSHQERQSGAYTMSRHVSGMSSGLPRSDDISYEYQGRLPQKHSAIGVSQNSGVNCIGLEHEQTAGSSYQRSRSYRHTVEESTSNDGIPQYDLEREHEQARNQEYQRSRSYRHTVSENVEAKSIMDSGMPEVHIYANVHVSKQDIKPKLPERTHRKAQRSVLDSQKEEEQAVPNGTRLGVHLPECDRRSEDNSDRGTTKSNSSQDRSSHDSAMDGTESSEHSLGTVINTQACQHKHPEELAPQICKLALGDSGFSSPRVSEISNESQRLTECNLSKEQNSFMCNNLKPETKLNNSVGKLDDSSEDSYGRISSDTLYENVKINQREVLNNMKYLHKEINVSSQNLTRQSSTQEPVSSEVDFEQKQAVVKKFNFEGDFHVVGVV